MQPVFRPDFEAFVAPARKRPQIWRLALGLLVVGLIYVGALFAGFSALVAARGAEAAMDLAQSLVHPGTPGAALLLLASFVAMAVAPMIVARLLHARTAGSLFGRAPIVLRHFVLAAAIVGAFYGAMLLVWAILYDARPNLDPRRWLALLPLTLAGLIVQTGAEELVFRGYLTQQAAARFRSPAVWLVGPALLFGAVHYDPTTAGPNAWIVMIGAALFGLAAADLTATTGSIGAAWGFHFANNFVALALVATEGTITGLALYVTPYTADTLGAERWVLMADFALLAVGWALCRSALRR